MPLVQLSVSPKLYVGLLDQRVIPALGVPINDVVREERRDRSWNGIPLFTGRSLNASVPVDRLAFIQLSSHITWQPNWIASISLYPTRSSFTMVGRQRGYQRSVYNLRPPVIRAVVTAGPIHDAGLSVMVQVAFVRVDHAEFVVGIEVMIEPHIELVAVGVVSVSVRWSMPLMRRVNRMPAVFRPSPTV